MRKEELKSIEVEARNFYLRTKGGEGTLWGGSMTPAIRGGWKIRIEPVDPAKIKIWDK